MSRKSDTSPLVVVLFCLLIGLVGLYAYSEKSDGEKEEAQQETADTRMTTKSILDELLIACDDARTDRGKAVCAKADNVVDAIDNGDPIPGPIGASGSDGEDGQDGQDGADGTNGQDGLNGLDGIKGLIGLQGPQGERGQRGEQGPPGENGQDGQNGSVGEVGLTGPQGPPGQGGEDGTDGVDGEDGEDGQDGTNGSDTSSPDSYTFNDYPLPGQTTTCTRSEDSTQQDPQYNCSVA